MRLLTAKQGKLVEAMRIWGEVVLPLAPAAYWDEFVRRLSISGHIDLVVTWLPFNDRSKVAPTVYQDLLTEPLQVASLSCQTLLTLARNECI